jgi:putative SOS response-associated peptidase YedK
MCNLYSVTKSEKAIIELVKAMRDLAGNMPPMPAIFPNKVAPVVRVAPDGVRELVMMKWGFPPPVIAGSKPRNPYVSRLRTPYRRSSLASSNCCCCRDACNRAD